MLGILESLHLINFQIWDDLFFQFVPGINAIIGPSDIGKSSALRALYWLTQNYPSGDEFLKHGAKFVSVEGVWPGGKVMRYRSKKENKYIINGVDFDTVGTSVPKEARDIMGLTDTNFQMQDDPFFLIGLPNSGEVAKRLNQVVGLNLIDTSLLYPKKIIRRMSTKIKSHESELKIKKKKLERFKNLDRIKSLNKKLEKERESLQETESAIEALRWHAEVLDTLRTQVKRYDHISEIEQIMNDVSKKKKELGKIESDADEIQKIIKVITQNQKIVRKYKKPYEKLEILNLEMNKVVAEWARGELKIKKLKESIETITKQNVWLDSREKKKNTLEKRFDSLKAELEICPICDTVFKKQ